ncbi:MAG: hypothetical protein LLF75_02320 [Eubacteriales bacterium]|nr:hypothetical protein [Eubacteriales bacterium]
MKFFTRDNITLALAIIGVLLSIGNVIYDSLSRRVKLSITSTFYKTYESSSGALQMYFHIANESAMPVAITRIQIRLKDEYIDCDPFPKKVFTVSTHSGDETEVEKVYYTLAMPISLPALGATSGFVQFHRRSGIFPLAPTEVDIIVSTNRRKKIKCRIIPPLDRTINDLF